MAIEPGTTVAHYNVVSKIGSGGRGEVYLADDTRLERKVGIKVLTDEFGRDEEKLIVTSLASQRPCLDSTIRRHCETNRSLTIGMNLSVTLRRLLIKNFENL